jgi:hypothetical protein
MEAVEEARRKRMELDALAAARRKAIVAALGAAFAAAAHARRCALLAGIDVARLGMQRAHTHLAMAQAAAAAMAASTHASRLANAAMLVSRAVLWVVSTPKERRVLLSALKMKQLAPYQLGKIMEERWEALPSHLSAGALGAAQYAAAQGAAESEAAEWADAGTDAKAEAEAVLQEERLARRRAFRGGALRLSMRRANENPRPFGAAPAKAKPPADDGWLDVQSPLRPEVLEPPPAAVAENDVLKMQKHHIQHPRGGYCGLCDDPLRMCKPCNDTAAGLTKEARLSRRSRRRAARCYQLRLNGFWRLRFGELQAEDTLERMGIGPAGAPPTTAPPALPMRRPLPPFCPPGLTDYAPRCARSQLGDCCPKHAKPVCFGPGSNGGEEGGGSMAPTAAALAYQNRRLECPAAGSGGDDDAGSEASVLVSAGGRKWNLPDSWPGRLLVANRLAKPTGPTPPPPCVACGYSMRGRQGIAEAARAAARGAAASQQWAVRAARAAEGAAAVLQLSRDTALALALAEAEADAAEALAEAAAAEAGSETPEQAEERKKKAVEKARELVLARARGETHAEQAERLKQEAKETERRHGSGYGAAGMSNVVKPAPTGREDDGDGGGGERHLLREAPGAWWPWPVWIAHRGADHVDRAAGEEDACEGGYMDGGGGAGGEYSPAFGSAGGALGGGDGGGSRRGSGAKVWEGGGRRAVRWGDAVPGESLVEYDRPDTDWEAAGKAAASAAAAAKA